MEGKEERKKKNKNLKDKRTKRAITYKNTKPFSFFRNMIETIDMKQR